jgi:hypothetical protein
MDISQMAVKGLKAIALSSNINRKPPDELHMSKEERRNLYTTVSQLGDWGVPVIGGSHNFVICPNYVNNLRCRASGSSETSEATYAKCRIPHGR